MNLLVKTASENEVKELRTTFQAMDRDGSGMILASELRDVLAQKHMNVSDTEIQDII